MKKLKGMLSIIFLFIAAGALTVQASDRDFNTGAGIKFEGAIETEEETKETEAETKETEAKATEKSTDKTDTGTPSSSKPSLPQTGQDSGFILQAVGVSLLLLIYWWTVGKNKGKSTIFPENECRTI